MRFAATQDGVIPEWKYYGEKHGWQLKLLARKRAVAYLIPRQGHFTAALALRPAALAAVRSSGLPEALIRAIDAAKPSSEGKPARVDVTGARELAWVKELIGIKLASLSGR